MPGTRSLEDVEIFLAFKTMELEDEVTWAELAVSRDENRDDRSTGYPRT